MKHRILYIIALFCLLFQTACHEESVLSTDNPSSQGDASLCLTITSRSNSPGDGAIEDGGGMQNLLILLVDQNNTIVKGELMDPLQATDATKKEIVFEGLELGNYTLYAYANKEGMSVNVGGKFTQRDQTFETLSETATPNTKANESLLTAKQDISIKVGENHTTLQMLRTVAKFRMIIFNHATSDIKIKNLTFGQFNSSTGYLFSHDGAIPPTNSYRNLPPYTLSDEQQRIKANESKKIYSAYLYESSMPNNDEYKFTLNLDVVELKGQDWSYEFQASSINKSDPFTISTTLNNKQYYLCLDESNNLKVEELDKPDANTLDNRFLWKFNEGKRNNNFLIFSLKGNNLYISIDNGSISIGKKDDTKKGRFKVSGANTKPLECENGYFLDLTDNLTLEAKKKGQHSQWSFHKKIQVNKPTTVEVVKASKMVEDKLVTVDRQTAHVSPLTKILRNQDVGIILNVYYNDKVDEFSFNVLSWDNGGGNVEFN